MIINTYETAVDLRHRFKRLIFLDINFLITTFYYTRA